MARDLGHGRFEIKLRGLDGDVLFFSDRPFRISGHEPASHLVSRWSAMGFEKDPPNGALVVPTGPKGHAPTTLEITHPRFDSHTNTLSLEATGVKGSDAAWLRELTPDTASANGHAVLFLDGTDFQLYGATRYINGLTIDGIGNESYCFADDLTWTNDNFNNDNLAWCQLIDANLSGTNFDNDETQGMDLLGANLTNTSWENDDLSNADFETGPGANGANFTGANLYLLQAVGIGFRYASFTNANLTSADLDWAEAQGASFTNATLNGTQLDGATAVGADFEGDDMQTSNFTEANIANANFDCINYPGLGLYAPLVSKVATQAGCNRVSPATALIPPSAVESRADLSPAYTAATAMFATGANMVNASFVNANLVAAQFTGADLAGANFEGADLQSANFDGADLQGANFDGAVLEGTQFGSANLSDAYFGGSEMYGAYLGHANLTDAYMPGEMQPDAAEGEKFPLLLDLAGYTCYTTLPNGENDNNDCGVVASAISQLALGALPGLSLASEATNVVKAITSFAESFDSATDAATLAVVWAGRVNNALNKILTHIPDAISWLQQHGGTAAIEKQASASFQAEVKLEANWLAAWGN